MTPERDLTAQERAFVRDTVHEHGLVGHEGVTAHTFRAIRDDLLELGFEDAQAKLAAQTRAAIQPRTLREHSERRQQRERETLQHDWHQTAESEVEAVKDLPVSMTDAIRRRQLRRRSAEGRSA